jgi:hypothetical protein
MSGLRFALILVAVAALFGVAKISRRVGLRLALLAAFALGLAYGAVKAENAWTGDGLVANAGFMIGTGVVLMIATTIAWAAGGLARPRSGRV